MTHRLTFAPAEVSPRNPLGRRLECVAQFPYSLLEMLDAEGGAAARCGLFSNWDDATTPRTATPARFCYLTGVPLSPCIARTYGQYARPVRIAR
jgi:hypothetical protein